MDPAIFALIIIFVAIGFAMILVHYFNKKETERQHQNSQIIRERICLPEDSSRNNPNHFCDQRQNVPESPSNRGDVLSKFFGRLFEELLFIEKRPVRQQIDCVLYALFKVRMIFALEIMGFGVEEEHCRTIMDQYDAAQYRSFFAWMGACAPSFSKRSEIADSRLQAYEAVMTQCGKDSFQMALAFLGDTLHWFFENGWKRNENGNLTNTPIDDFSVLQMLKSHSSGDIKRIREKHRDVFDLLDFTLINYCAEHVGDLTSAFNCSVSVSNENNVALEYFKRKEMCMEFIHDLWTAREYAEKYRRIADRIEAFFDERYNKFMQEMPSNEARHEWEKTLSLEVIAYSYYLIMDMQPHFMGCNTNVVTLLLSQTLLDMNILSETDSLSDTIEKVHDSKHHRDAIVKKTVVAIKEFEDNYHLTPLR